jgi:NAD(P)-dependent dehydrogenase (short-subunit alcohol dehydrogenase family)
MGKLDGRIAVVTAAGSGMGLACAKRFAEEGAHVFVTDIDESAEGKHLDVTVVDQLKAFFADVHARFGKLNVLHNHAGLPGPPGLDVVEDQFDRVIDVNMKSAFFATSIALPLLQQAAPQASVIFTSSISGLMSAPSSPLYGMTKGGVVNLSRSLARQLGPSGIRVNTICPGPIDTPMLRAFVDPAREGLTGEAADKQLQARRASIPLRRLGTTEDIASVALFLASDDSAFVTGVAIPVDGGMCA